MGAAERRLVDSNVRGFASFDDGTGLTLILFFRRSVNVSGIPSARIVSAADAAGRPLPALAGTDAEIRVSSATDDPTALLRLRLYARSAHAAATRESIRTIAIQLGNATIRARFDQALF